MLVSPPRLQLSPAVEHISGQSWSTSYAPVSYKLESKLGSRVKLAAAIKACKAAGVGVIADVLFNRALLVYHGRADCVDMANTHLSGSRGINGSAVGDYSFAAVPYSKSDFHQNCGTSDNKISNWDK